MLPKPVGMAELLRPALAIAEARAAKRGVSLRASIAATAPRVLVDPVHAQDARDDGADGDRRAGDTRARSCTWRRRRPATGRCAWWSPAPSRVAHPSLALRLADELIRAQGGTFRLDGGAVTIEFPAEQVRRARP